MTYVQILVAQSIFMCLRNISASCCTYLCVCFYLRTQNVLVLLNCQHFDSDFTGHHEFDCLTCFTYPLSSFSYVAIISDSTVSVNWFSSFSGEFLIPDSSRIKATALHVRLISCMQISIGFCLPVAAYD